LYGELRPGGKEAEATCRKSRYKERIDWDHHPDKRQCIYSMTLVNKPLLRRFHELRTVLGAKALCSVGNSRAFDENMDSLTQGGFQTLGVSKPHSPTSMQIYKVALSPWISLL
jgi:hypothetical protein